MIRKTSVAGSFYPNSNEELIKYFKHFSQDLEEQSINLNPKAVIVPHAGYIYSGFTANAAYYFSKEVKKKRCIVIGPSHRVYYEGASVSLHDNYETPLGNITVAKEYALQLKEQFDFLSFEEQLHHEHSTETQAPFIKYYFDEVEIIEIVYGKVDEKKLAILIDFCLQDSDNFIVISTDLSHFHELKVANYIDNICLEAILNKDIKKFDEGCEACGLIGVKAMIEASIKNSLDVEFLNYCTSYDKTKDDSRVVGYTSFLIGEKRK